MKDLRRYGDNYRTREIRVAVSTATPKSEGNELILFKLPKDVMILRTYVCVVEPDETSGATIDVVAYPAYPKPTTQDIVASDKVLSDEVAIDSKGVKGCAGCEAQLFDKEMVIATRNGAAAGTGASFVVVVEFLELNTVGDDGLLQIPRLESEIIKEGTATDGGK